MSHVTIAVRCWGEGQTLLWCSWGGCLECGSLLVTIIHSNVSYHWTDDSFLARALDRWMATLRNVDDIVPWALGCPGVRRQAASHQEGEALLLRKHSFLEQECHQSLSEGLCLLYLPSCLKKNLCYEKFQTHTKVRRTCNEARTSVPNIQRLSGCRHRRLICPSFSFPFPLLEYFKANPRHHVISPSCTSVGIKKKISMPPAIFRTRCWQEPLRQASFSGDLCGRSMPGLDLRGYLPSSQSGTHVISGWLGLGLRTEVDKKHSEGILLSFWAPVHKQPDGLGISGVFWGISLKKRCCWGAQEVGWPVLGCPQYSSLLAPGSHTHDSSWVHGTDWVCLVSCFLCCGCFNFLHDFFLSLITMSTLLLISGCPSYYSCTLLLISGCPCQISWWSL